jgi:hypothetical protein
VSESRPMVKVRSGASDVRRWRGHHHLVRRWIIEDGGGGALNGVRVLRFGVAAMGELR